MVSLSELFTYKISNNSDLYFEVEPESGDGTGNVTLFSRTAQKISAPAGQINLQYKVVTAFVRSDQHLVVHILLKE